MSNNNFLDLCRHIGETVTIFTTSGGVSGCGFTGVLLSVNPCFVRLMTRRGSAPSSPLAENICGRHDNGICPGGLGPNGIGPGHGKGGYPDMEDRPFVLGSVCDIPIDKIASFCHNAV